MELSLPVVVAYLLHTFLVPQFPFNSSGIILIVQGNGEYKADWLSFQELHVLLDFLGLFFDFIFGHCSDDSHLGLWKVDGNFLHVFSFCQSFFHLSGAVCAVNGDREGVSVVFLLFWKDNFILSLLCFLLYFIQRQGRDDLQSSFLIVEICICCGRKG